MFLIYRKLPTGFYAPDSGGAMDISGDMAADAAPQQTGEEIPLVAGEEKEIPEEDFESLIKGKYKAEYDRKVQSIVKQRLKGNEETIKKYQALAPGLKLLARQFGLEEEDTEGINGALLTAFNERNQAPSPEEKESRAVRLAQEQCLNWLDETAGARRDYPELDLAKELENPRFARLIKSGVPVREAYELANRDELMRQTLEAVRKEVAAGISSGAMRPAEAGIVQQSTANIVPDVGKMSKSTRQEIIRRVQRGEKISF